MRQSVTGFNGNTTSQTSPAEQKQAMKEAGGGRKAGKTEKYGKTGQGKGVLHYSDRHGESLSDYWLGRRKKCIFWTEVTENDLLNATSDNSETLPKNSAALESAIPNGESALPNNNGEQADTEGKETETEKGTEGAESTWKPNRSRKKEAPNPMIS